MAVDLSILDALRGPAAAPEPAAHAQPRRSESAHTPGISAVVGTPGPVRTGAPPPGMTAPAPRPSGVTPPPVTTGPRMPATRAPEPPPRAPEPPPRVPEPPARAPDAAAGDDAPCPKCGKPVTGANAFCGTCGHRLKPAAPGVAGGTPVVRTMFMAPATSKPMTRGHLTLVRPDGTEGGMHPLQEGENLIGRGQGPLFDADPYLSPRHAELALGDNGLVVRDLKSLNGVFVKIAQEEKLESGDIFRIGQELLRFDLIGQPSPLEDGTEINGTPNPGYWGRISVIIGRDVEGPAFPLFDESIVLGRERGDILFPEDGYVSGTHAQITLRDGHVHLSDLGSSNGTFFRMRGSRTVPPGSMVLMGQQLFRVAYS